MYYILDGLRVWNNQKKIDLSLLIGGLNSQTTSELASCTGVVTTRLVVVLKS
jgi:hypothetical protein